MCTKDKDLVGTSSGTLLNMYSKLGMVAHERNLSTWGSRSPTYSKSPLVEKRDASYHLPTLALLREHREGA